MWFQLDFKTHLHVSVKVCIQSASGHYRCFVDSLKREESRLYQWHSRTHHSVTSDHTSELMGSLKSAPSQHAALLSWPAVILPTDATSHFTGRKCANRQTAQSSFSFSSPAHNVAKVSYVYRDVSKLQHLFAILKFAMCPIWHVQIHVSQSSQL